MTAAAARKQEALTVFSGHGIPTRRVEEWKYSDLKTALGDAGLGEATAQWSVGVLPGGIELFDLSQPDAPDWVSTHIGALTRNAVSSASLAFAKGGVALRVAKNKMIGAPLNLEFSGDGHVRALIVLEEGTSLTVFERGTPASPRNVGMEIIIGANAALNHVRIADSQPGVQVEEIALTLARDARYNGHFANFGSKLSRVELTIALEGAGAEAGLSGVSVLGGQTHADVTTHIIHRVANTRSSQIFKKVVGAGATAVYQGKVTVAKGADGSDSSQTAKALLIGMRAEADLKPELEIFADDVKCAHGAAVGDLDVESLFYLRARGIPENEARDLLIHAFLEDALTGIAQEVPREMVRTAVNDALAQVSA